MCLQRFMELSDITVVIKRLQLCIPLCYSQKLHSFSEFLEMYCLPVSVISTRQCGIPCRNLMVYAISIVLSQFFADQNSVSSYDFNPFGNEFSTFSGRPSLILKHLCNVCPLIRGCSYFQVLLKASLFCDSCSLHLEVRDCFTSFLSRLSSHLHLCRCSCSASNSPLSIDSSLS